MDFGRLIAGAFCLALGLLVSSRLPAWWRADTEPMRTTHSEYVVTPGVAHGILRALVPVTVCLCFGGVTALMSGLMPETASQRPFWLSVPAAIAAVSLACAALIVLVNRPRWLVPRRFRQEAGIIGEWRMPRVRR